MSYIIGAVLSAIATICLLIGWYNILIDVNTANRIDEKIAMLEEENAEIEQSIDSIVKNYMNYEANTYERFKDEDAINLVSLFPELKSDTLVQQQIEVYVANKQEIKTLKKDRIDLSKLKFELYFGR